MDRDSRLFLEFFGGVVFFLLCFVFFSFGFLTLPVGGSGLEVPTASYLKYMGGNKEASGVYHCCVASQVPGS